MYTTAARIAPPITMFTVVQMMLLKNVRTERPYLNTRKAPTTALTTFANVPSGRCQKLFACEGIGVMSVMFALRPLELGPQFVFIRRQDGDRSIVCRHEIGLGSLDLALTGDDFRPKSGFSLLERSDFRLKLGQLLPFRVDRLTVVVCLPLLRGDQRINLLRQHPVE